MEKTFEVMRDATGFIGVVGSSGSLLSTVASLIGAEVGLGDSARVTVRVEPLPERVKWPWPDVSRVRVSEAHPDGYRSIQIRSNHQWLIFRDHSQSNYFGTWPPDESRIATNDNGYVKLSEVPDA